MMKWLLLLAVLLVGCIKQPSSEYLLQVNPSMGSDGVKLVKEAAKEWETATNHQLKFDVDLTDKPTYFQPTIYVSLATSYDLYWLNNDLPTIGWTDRNGWFDIATSSISNELLLYPTRYYLFRRTVMHELGHAMGLYHDIPGTIMAPDDMHQSDHITCRDAQTWAKIHNTHITCRPYWYRLN